MEKNLFINNEFNNNENRGDKKPPQKKPSNFKLYKNNTIKSLKDVDQFLNNFQYYSKYFKLFKILK